MKIFLIFILLVILAVALGVYVEHTPNMVQIQYGNWLIQTSVPIAVLGLLIFFLVLWFLLYCIHGTWLWPERLRLWGRRRKEQKMLTLTQQGLLDLLDGKWQPAEHHLTKAADFSPWPFINDLGAAYAAYQQNALERRDQYLQNLQHSQNLKIRKSTMTLSNLQIQLLQAGFYLFTQQWEQARIILTQLQQTHPKHPLVLKGLTTVYTQQEQWSLLQPLLPYLQKQELYSSEYHHYLSIQSAQAFLTHAAQEKNPDALTQAWRQISPNLQMELITHYVALLIKNKQNQQALILIERYLKQRWNPNLLAFYANLSDTDLNKQLQCAESWLPKHPEDPALLYCLGILCLRNQLWGKAADYLTDALSRQPNGSTHIALAEVYTALQQPMKALEQYRLALI